MASFTLRAESWNGSWTLEAFVGPPAVESEQRVLRARLRRRGYVPPLRWLMDCTTRARRAADHSLSGGYSYGGQRLSNTTDRTRPGSHPGSDHASGHGNRRGRLPVIHPKVDAAAGTDRGSHGDRTRGAANPTPDGG
jgi:hypothetical protein